jgi:plasmid stabilization system protein ParE
LSHAYVLTAAAEADVRSIIRYTRQQWGEAQVRAYMAKLEQGSRVSPTARVPTET